MLTSLQIVGEDATAHLEKSPSGQDASSRAMSQCFFGERRQHLMQTVASSWLEMLFAFLGSFC